MKNILVTGGAGYIGSHTVRELLKNGYQPIVFDNFENGHVDNITGAIYYTGDIRNIQSIKDVFTKETIYGVIHFAAYASVPDSVDMPDKYYTNNIIGSLNLLNVMNSSNVKKIIFSSSASVYGEPLTEVIQEDHRKHPTNPYGHSKLIFEEILKWYFIAYGISSLSFRYFCASGASSDGLIGELHEPETHVIPNAILTALGKRDKFMIYGDDFPTPDGTGVRDFIHVEDLASAHVMGISVLDTPMCEQCNLGIGKGFSVKEIIDAVKECSGKDFLVEIAGRRKGDPSILIADNTKAKKLIPGWAPKYMNIQDIVKTAFIFLKNHYVN